MKTPANYSWNGFTIPARMAGGLLRWVQHGIPPGDFLQAVLRNDLKAACERGDDESLANLPAYPAWLYNCAPESCWGSPEKVAEWRGTDPIGGHTYPVRAEEPQPGESELEARRQDATLDGPIETTSWPMPGPGRTL